MRMWVRIRSFEHRVIYQTKSVVFSNCALKLQVGQSIQPKSFESCNAIQIQIKYNQCRFMILGYLFSQLVDERAVKSTLNSIDVFSTLMKNDDFESTRTNFKIKF